MLAASDSKALAPAAEQADKVNIPVIAIDSGVESDKIKSFIATDNVQAGEKAADTLAGMIGKKATLRLSTSFREQQRPWIANKDLKREAINIRT